MASVQTTTVAKSTIHLNGAPDEDIGNSKPTAKAVQAFQIELARETVREMQRHMRNGKAGIQLMMGKSPLLKFGSRALPLRINTSDFRTEVYEETDKKHHQFKAIVTHNISTTKKTEETFAGAEAGFAQLQQKLDALAKEKAENKAVFLDNLPDTKIKSKKTHVMLRLPAAARGSMPASPAATAAAAATSTTKKAPVSEAHRTAVLHYLAIAPEKQVVIAANTRVPTEDLLRVLAKYANQSFSDLTWTLSDRAYKSLDVWRFPYRNQADRQKAIENAIRAFDRLRFPIEDKVWDALLPEGQRGKNGPGKTLSKLNLRKSEIQAQVPFQPKPFVRPAVDNPDRVEASSHTSIPNHRTLLSGIGGIGGEAMARQKSLESMALKGSKSEAHINKIIKKKPTNNNSTPKMAPKTVVKKNTSATKPTQKRKQGEGEVTEGMLDGDRIISEEENSAYEEMIGTKSPLANGKSKTAQKEAAGQTRKTQKEFKSAERISDSDLSSDEVTATNYEATRKVKRPAPGSEVTKPVAPSSTSKNLASEQAKSDRPEVVGKLQRPTTAKASGSTKTGKNNEISEKTAAPAIQKLATNKDTKSVLPKAANKTIVPSSSPQVAAQPISKKKTVASSIGLGISLGGTASGVDDTTTSTSKAMVKKQPTVVAKETATSSATSWASSLSAKSTPMHRQSSSQSSVSFQLSEIPRARKRPADAAPAENNAPPSKKLKHDMAPAKPSPQASSSPLSDLQSMSTPSDHDEVAAGLQKSSSEEEALDREKREVKAMKQQLRTMYAAFLRRRMEYDLAPTLSQPALEAALEAASAEITDFSEKVKNRALAASLDYEYHSGLPRGVVVDAEVKEYCHKKAIAVREEYNALRMEEGKEEAVRELYAEYLDLMKVVYPVDVWNPVA